MKELLIKKATTICLPNATVYKIAKELDVRNLLQIYSIQKIVLLCLSRYLKLYQPEEFDERETCRYNKDSCRTQVKIRLTKKEHHSIKMHRLTLQYSASFLCCLAVEEFLVEIMTLLDTINGLVEDDEKRLELEQLCKSLGTIHRKIAFKAKNIFKLVIVIPNPSRIRNKNLPSGHQGWPYRRRFGKTPL